MSPRELELMKELVAAGRQGRTYLQLIALDWPACSKNTTSKHPWLASMGFGTDHPSRATGACG